MKVLFIKLKYIALAGLILFFMLMLVLKPDVYMPFLYANACA